MKSFCYHPFDLRQLVSLAEIARTGSFRQAAKTLYVAQPALMAMAFELAQTRPPYEDIASKFFEHFVAMSFGQTSIFLKDASGRRAVHGQADVYAKKPDLAKSDSFL